MIRKYASRAKHSTSNLSLHQDTIKNCLSLTRIYFWKSSILVFFFYKFVSLQPKHIHFIQTTSSKGTVWSKWYGQELANWHNSKTKQTFVCLCVYTCQYYTPRRVLRWSSTLVLPAASYEALTDSWWELHASSDCCSLSDRSNIKLYMKHTHTSLSLPDSHKSCGISTFRLFRIDSLV